MVEQQFSDSSVTEAHNQGRNQKRSTTFLYSATHNQALERATRHFYTRFKDERLAFLTHIHGLSTASERETYVSLMFSRLLLLYFLQKKCLLDNDADYLGSRLQTIRKQQGHDSYYHNFLLRLFHEGLGKSERTSEIQVLLGNVPYLGGDLFTVHEIERNHPDLFIPDQAFIGLFAFFDKYRWELHEHQLLHDNDVTPEVLGYVLEKYVNQAQMGAYYTGTDVTTYITRNTIIPCLFDSAVRRCPEACRSDAQLWRGLQENPERYIYGTMSSETYLPGETAHEYEERRASYMQLRARLQAGQVQSIDDLITWNLDINQFAQDVLHTITDTALLYAFYTGLQELTILDPTCGSGAFLFAALHVLEPLYTACLERMQELALTITCPQEFYDILRQIQAHPNRQYFIRKTIITRHLYGVDLMEEAITTCKLRLFLALVAWIEYPEDIEPLPIIDAHLRTGNALLGDVRHGSSVDDEVGTLDKADEWDAMNNGLYDGGPYIVKESYILRSHRPFHWDCEFADVLGQGGFSVIIGNPPYVEYNQKMFPYELHDFATLACANLYPCVVERSYQLLAQNGRSGMILPLAAFATRNMIPLLNGFLSWFPCSWLSFYHFRPSMLFSGHKAANIPTAIYLAKASGATKRFSTGLNKWQADYRGRLFTQLSYCPVTTPRDPENRHYYPKFGNALENSILDKVLSHACVNRYLADQSNDNTMFYRSAGGLYWKIFINYPWPYQTTSNKQCSFLAEYDRDVFVALFNSSLFWWYYTISFDTFNLKDYMLFGFRFSYPEDNRITSSLRMLCQQLMDNFRKHARHLKRGNTDSYTIYARKAKAIIDEIDRLLAKHYGFSTEELDFILNYDIKYRVGLIIKGELS
jgi:tRNA1(Val) A37 N6-methylase TrmN6